MHLFSDALGWRSFPSALSYSRALPPRSVRPNLGSLCREEEEGLTFPARIDNAIQMAHWVAILSLMVFADLRRRMGRA
jgi:hypothetical protein